MWDNMYSLHLKFPLGYFEFLVVLFLKGCVLLCACFVAAVLLGPRLFKALCAAARQCLS